MSDLRILAGPRVGNAPVEISIRNSRELWCGEIDPRRPDQWLDICMALEEAYRENAQGLLRLIAARVGYKDPATTRKFPTQALPAAMLDLVSLGEEMGLDAGLVAVPALATAATAIGKTAYLHVRGSWDEAPVLWMLVAAPVAAGKTPGRKLAAAPLYRADAALMAAFEVARDAYEDAVAEAKRTGDKKPPFPTVPMIVGDDMTVEALARRLRDNPRGCGGSYDEFGTFLYGMNQYRQGGRGADRSRYCQLWSVPEPWRVDRAGDQANPLLIHRPHFSIFGCVPLDLLPKIAARDDSQDGLLSRFLTACIEAEPHVEDEEVETRRRSDGWDETVAALLQAPGDVAREVRMDERAKKLWRDYRHEIKRRIQDSGASPAMTDFYGKCPSHLARLALVLHVTDVVAPAHQTLPLLDRGVMERAWEILQYFCDNREPMETGGGGLGLAAKADEPADRLVTWMRRTGRSTVTPRDVIGARVPGIRARSDVEQVFARVVDRGQGTVASTARGVPTLKIADLA